MSRVQTAVAVSLGALAALLGAITLLVRRRAAHRADLLRTKARDMRERAEADRIEIARREAEAARIAARVRATHAEVEADEPTDAGAGEPAAVGASASVPPSDQADLAERLRYADEVDPELPARVVAERDRGDDVR